MNTHSCKVNKCEPFKTNQEKFLETFQNEKNSSILMAKGVHSPHTGAFAT